MKYFSICLIAVGIAAVITGGRIFVKEDSFGAGAGLGMALTGVILTLLGLLTVFMP